MRPFAAAVLGLPLVLCGCAGVSHVGSALLVAKTGYDVAEKISAVADPVIDKGCAEYQKGRAYANSRIAAGLVPAPTTKLVTAVYAFGDAMCSPGNPPPTNTIETVIWLGQLVGQVKTMVDPPMPGKRS